MPQKRAVHVLVNTGVILLIIGGLYAVLMPTYQSIHEYQVKDHQYHANTRAISRAAGFVLSALGSTKGADIVAVAPVGPAARAGLKPGDKITQRGYAQVRELILRQRGKTLVLPIERAGRHFDATVLVPDFALPFPDPNKLPS